VFEAQGWEDGGSGKRGRREVSDAEVEIERERGVQSAGFVLPFLLVYLNMLLFGKVGNLC
jgi:hypothetical protein